jgi:hypothetical protein
VSRCPFPEHHQSSGGGSGGRAALVLLAVLLVSALAKPVATAADSVARVVAEVVTIAVIAVASAAGLAALAGLVLVAVRVRRRILARPRAVPYRVTVLDGRQAAEVAEPDRRALPAARDGVSAYPRVHADPHVVTSRAARPRCTRQRGRRS